MAQRKRLKLKPDWKCQHYATIKVMAEQDGGMDGKCSVEVARWCKTCGALKLKEFGERDLWTYPSIAYTEKKEEC